MVARFQELVAWQLCVELHDVIVEITSGGPAAANKRYQEQIRDAAESAPSLIAEGFCRFTTAEFVRYLRMARGELAEVQSRLHVGRRRNYFSDEDAERADLIARRAMGTTTNLLKSKLRQLEEEDAKRRRRC
jgi:four helix bundle protein